MPLWAVYYCILLLKRAILIVRKLVHNYRCDVMAKDDNGNTPLHLAALGGSLSTVCKLIDEFKCDPNTKGFQGRTPLHHAADKGYIEIIRTLIHEYGCDVMSKEDNGNTPLHLAALGGSLSRVCTLIDEFKCDPNTKGFQGRIPLHSAAEKGHVDIVWKLVFTYGGDINIADYSGKTIWDYIVQSSCGSSVKRISEMALKTYKKMTSYSSLIHVLVVGSPGAGKSTLVEALKSDTRFRRQVTNVPPHTAGIIPHTFEGRGNGKIIFYDFAGDPLFNFSQTAVMEQITFEHNNVVLIVVDISKPVKVEGIIYWLQLIFHVNKKFPNMIIVGSHADLLPCDPERELSQICNDLSSVLTAEYSGSNFSTITYVSLDCRYTRSDDLQKLHTCIQDCSKNDDTKRISSAAVILYQIVSDVGKNSLACNLSEVRRYTTQIGAGLSTDASFTGPRSWNHMGMCLSCRIK